MLTALTLSLLGQTQIYLAEYKFDDPRLYVMEPGGANLQELAIVPAADWLLVGVQVDPAAEKIYWTHGSFNNGRIRRANLDGTGLETLVSGLTNPRGLAIDPAGGRLYWSDTQDDRMYRADLDGGAPETIVDIAHQLGRPTLDLDAGMIYFGKYDAAGGGDMRRAALDGTGMEVLFGDLYTPVAAALDPGAGRIYWADSNTSFVSNHIVRADFDGGNLEVLYEGLPTSSGFTGIGVDLAAGRLFWCDEITDAEKGVWEANLDGTGATRIYESPTGWNAGAMTVVVGDAEPPCAADVTGDGVIDVQDLVAIIVGWGPCDECGADVTGDGSVDVLDLVEVILAWGSC